MIITAFLVGEITLKVITSRLKKQMMMVMMMVMVMVMMIMMVVMMMMMTMTMIPIFWLSVKVCWFLSF